MSTYNCSKCGFSTKIKGNLKRHILNVCNDGDIIENIVKVKCDICDKEYQTEVLLNQHKKVCVQKKTVTVREFTDSDAVHSEMELLKKVIMSVSASNEHLSKQLIETTKRIEKLEKSINKEKQDQKRGFEELTVEQVDDDALACVNERIRTHVATDYEDLLKHDDKKNYEKNKLSIQKLVSILDKSGKILSGCIASENGVKIVTDKGEKKLPYGDLSFVISRKSCRNEPKFRVLKTELCYCSNHFNEEKGEPLD